MVFDLRNFFYETWNPEIAMKDHEIPEGQNNIVTFREVSWKLMEFICRFPPTLMKGHGLIR